MPPRIQPPLVSAAVPSPQTHCGRCLARAFSTSQPREYRLKRTMQRRQMDIWMQTVGENFRKPIKDMPNYLTSLDRDGTRLSLMHDKYGRPFARPSRMTESDQGRETEDSKNLKEAAQDDSRPGSKGKLREFTIDPETVRRIHMPFPLNGHFISQSIPSENLRVEVYKRVQEQGKSVREVSVELGVEMRRVGAIVRLMELENRMKAKGERLARPYQKAIHGMIPTTPYNIATGKITRHEPITDLPHHSLTNPQLFYPTSESRAFNRVDAGRVFSAAPRLADSQDVGQGGHPVREPWQDTVMEMVGKKGKGDGEMPVLKPADARIPHPHLIAFEKDKLDPSLSSPAGEQERRVRYMQRLKDDDEVRRMKREDKERAEEEKKTRVETGRWEVVVTDRVASREGTGLDGRGTGSVGFRYGVPHRDRKRGEHKIVERVNT